MIHKSKIEGGQWSLGKCILFLLKSILLLKEAEAKQKRSSLKENQVNPEQNDFFELEISKEHNEIEEFLHSKDSSLTMLKSFPSIKEIFC